MKPIAILILGMGLLGSAVVQAQQSGQGSAVPRQPVLVAQAGTIVAPGAVPVAAPVLAAGTNTFLIFFGATLAGVAAAGNGGDATVRH